jgi:geranylgeranyl reductase family protein
MHDYEVVIAGAGPSGSAAALQLIKLDPRLSGRVLLLDKAVFPRTKLCAGGVTQGAELILSQLGIRIDLQSIPVHASRFVFPSGLLTVDQANQFRVFRRSEFDHYLVRTARERGAVIHEGEAVKRLTWASDAIIVYTSKQEYRAKVLIGADGANSTVRRLLRLRRHGRVMMGMEIQVPADQVFPGPGQNVASFDYTQVSCGLPGYCWIFPSRHEGLSMLSLGILEASFGTGKRSSLKSAFSRWLTGRGLDLRDFNLQAHPALRYCPRLPCAKHRVLLVGDALGVDPLFGEGITSALGLGVIAAESALCAITANDFSFSQYEQHIRSSLIGNIMRRRSILARRLYGQYGKGPQAPMEDLFSWAIPLDPKETSTAVSWRPTIPRTGANNELKSSNEH